VGFAGAFVTDGPGFGRPVQVVAGEVVEREGFVFADLLPGGSARGLEGRLLGRAHAVSPVPRAALKARPGLRAARSRSTG
jgi:hypothetical protein